MPAFEVGASILLAFMFLYAAVFLGTRSALRSFFGRDHYYLEEHERNEDDPKQ